MLLVCSQCVSDILSFIMIEVEEGEDNLVGHWTT